MKRLLVTAALFLACLAPISAIDVPDESEIKSLSDKMLLDWNRAIQKGDFSAFYKNDCAKVWQEQTTAEKLDDTFTKQFGGQKIESRAQSRGWSRTLSRSQPSPKSVTSMC